MKKLKWLLLIVFVISLVILPSGLVFAGDINEYKTHNPSFEEMKDFLLSDITSHNQFIDGKYECINFAFDVNNNAKSKGIRCGIVILRYVDLQHALLGFDTTDRGMIYIEPQTDTNVTDIVKSGYYQGKKIKDILIAW